MFSPEDILRITDHRPWPLPRGPWVMMQGWYDLLFAHWPLPVEQLRPLIPAPLKLQTFDGKAWLSVTPFHLTFQPRGLPLRLRCPELNCRTYVEHGGKAGIFFFSLDAGSRLAVWGARMLYLLPYFHADATIGKQGGGIDYSLRRSGGKTAFRARYGPLRPSTPTAGAPGTPGLGGGPRQSRSGTLEHWLTERYCLYTHIGRRLLRGEIHHAPWPLEDGECELRENSIPQAAGIHLPDIPPLLHFARGVDVLVWPLKAAL